VNNGFLKYTEKMQNIFFIGFLLISFTSGYAQNFSIKLWTGTVPNSIMTEETEIREQKDILYIRNVQEPEIDVYLPAGRHATGEAVIICPGGGYRVLAYDWEGADIARWFNSKGIAAIVLKYRLPVSNSIIVRHEAPLQDAQRAIRMVRQYAEDWNINKNRIGIMGFSAGGHLASTLGTKFDYQTFDSVDEIDRISARPDFMILIYPVISFREKFSHSGSRDALLGNDASQELIDFYSNELHVSSDTPPAFLVHSGDDKGVPVENSLYFYQALKNKGISSEMHIYPYGGHGYSLAIGRGYLQSWTERLNDWLKNTRDNK
jgi:acetyl esterase/lipase